MSDKYVTIDVKIPSGLKKTLIWKSKPKKIFTKIIFKLEDLRVTLLFLKLQ